MAEGKLTDWADKAQADGVPEAKAAEVLEREIRELHLAVKQAFLYPAGHPVRVKAADEIRELLEQLLSSRENHSLVAIGDKIYIDQQEMKAKSPDGQLASDEASADIARKFRQRGIRSVTFSRGIETRELERFLDIMTMKPREVKDQGGVGGLLQSVSDVSHIKIVDIEYDSIQFVTDEDKEGSVDVRELLLSYLSGRSENLATEAYPYLSSLLNEPELMARLIEESAGYDGISEPDGANITQCIHRLVGLEEQLTEANASDASEREEFFPSEEKNFFQKKLLEAVSYMDRPVKNVIFSEFDDNSILANLMSGLSVGEIGKFLAMECTKANVPEAKAEANTLPPVPLRRVLYELSTSDQSPVLGSPEERLAEVEAAIQAGLLESGREEVFNNTVVPILEEVFVELEVDRLEAEQLELENLLDESHSPEQRQRVKADASGVDEIANLLTAEDNIVNSVVVMLEMLEPETDLENYSDIVSQLEEIAGLLISESESKKDIRDQYLDVIFRIVDALSKHADLKSNKSLELQKRARMAIVNIGTEENIDLVLSSSLRAEHLEWDALERFTKQMVAYTSANAPAIPLLVKNLLDADNPPERQKLGKIIISMGRIAIPELHKWLSKGQWVVVIKDIMPILSEIGGTEALDCFSDALNHSNLQVRRSAVNALAANKSAEALEMILNKVRDEKEERSLRQLAISVLGEMTANATANAIVKVIGEIEKILNSKGFRNFALKIEAIHALSIIDGEKSISILSSVLKQKHLILGRRRLEELQLHTVEALSLIGTQSAIEVLLEVSQKKKGNVREKAQAAIGASDKASKRTP